MQAMLVKQFCRNVMADDTVRQDTKMLVAEAVARVVIDEHNRMKQRALKIIMDSHGLNKYWPGNQTDLGIVEVITEKINHHAETTMPAWGLLRCIEGNVCYHFAPTSTRHDYPDADGNNVECSIIKSSNYVVVGPHSKDHACTPINPGTLAGIIQQGMLSDHNGIPAVYLSKNNEMTRIKQVVIRSDGHGAQVVAIGDNDTEWNVE